MNRAAMIAGCVIVVALVFALQVVVRERSIAWAGGTAAALLIVFMIGIARRGRAVGGR